VRAALALALASCAAPPAFAWRGEALGADVAVGGYLETRQVFRVDRDTTPELNLQRLQLELNSWWGDHVSLALIASLQNGGPATRETRAGFYNIDDVFQSVSPAIEIEEATLRLDWDSLELRLGQVKYAWGKLDRYQPNDSLNPERFADPILLDEGERKIGVPSIEATWFLPSRSWLPEQGSFSFVVVPRYVPFRLARKGERWFPPNATPPPTYSVPLDGGGTFDVPLSLETSNTSPPAFTAENASYAARFGAFWRGLDYALYYYHGIQTAPLFRLEARGNAPTEDMGVTGTTILSPVFNPIDVWGGDLAFTWGRFSFRAEAAYTRDRGFNRDLLSLVDDPAVLESIKDALDEIAAGAPSAEVDLGPSFVVSDAVQWGVGMDTRVYDFDVLFEVSQTNVLENHLPLLIKDAETVLLADLRRAFLRDDLTLQLISIYGASSDYTVLMPRLTYRFYDRFEVRLGYLHIAGRSRSRLGQYKNNDEGYIRLRVYL
jgi:hypothetical protein